MTNWEIDAHALAKPLKGTTRVVVDTPAGLHGKRLNDVVKVADHIVVP